MNNISVVYTPFTNLKKTAGMDVGQVGFKSQKKVSHCYHLQKFCALYSALYLRGIYTHLLVEAKYVLHKY